VLLTHEGATEFESLDMAVHMLFLAGTHCYPTIRRIALPHSPRALMDDLSLVFQHASRRLDAV